jgi:hypothetical protein
LGILYDLLVDRKKKLVPADVEEQIIQILEKRLVEVIAVDSWAAECAVERLARYYQKSESTTDVERVLDLLDMSFQTTATHVLGTS